MASNFIKWSNWFSLATICSKVTKLPYGVNPAYLGHRTHLVTTQVNAPTSPSPPSAPTKTTPPPPTKLYHLTFQVLALEPPEAGSIPLWILILAILAGLLFLSILTAILYKLGFFRWLICFCVRKQVFILRKDDLIFNDLSVQEEKAGGLQLPRHNPGLSCFWINISKIQTYSGKSPKHDKMQKKVKIWSRPGEQQPNAISINFSSWLCTEAGVFVQVS